MTADFIEQLIAGLPNLGALLVMLYWQQRRIDLILKHANEVDSRLLGLLEECIHPSPPPSAE